MAGSHPKTLHLHSSGPQVRALQSLLRSYEPQLVVDGRFGPKTERAVRAAQRKLGIFPVDGLAGPHTLAALAQAASQSARRPQPPTRPSTGTGLRAMAGHAGSMATTTLHDLVTSIEHAVRAIEDWLTGLHPHPASLPPVLLPVVPPAREKAKREAAPPGEVANPKNMLLSEAGRQFLFRLEAGKGLVTAHLHHPAGHSGVTIGPGYDMKDRTVDDVAAALRSIGVDSASAATAARGAGLHDAAADDFVREHKSLLNLDIAQQIQLQRFYKGQYERMVHNAVHIPLHQYEFDALVSFACNPGHASTWHAATHLVNEHRPHDAAAEFFKAIHTGNPKLIQGLRNRRTAESKLFLYGDYGG